MINLGIISNQFPTIGENVSNDPESSGSLNSVNAKQPPPLFNKPAQCNCSRRTEMPPLPEKLPFPCSAENNSKMEKWLLEREG